MCDFLFSSSGRNSQVHSWPLPVSVCPRRGAGSVVIDSSEGGGSVTAQKMDTFKVGSKIKTDKALAHNYPVRVKV